eukprot:g3268.t1
MSTEPMTKEELKRAITQVPRVTDRSGQSMSPEELAAAVRRQNEFEGRLNAFAHGQLPAIQSSEPKKISQDTFMEVVNENMEEFDMEREEAVQDAIEQFQAQNVDLSDVNLSEARLEKN